jgi:hypothetical protein
MYIEQNGITVKFLVCILEVLGSKPGGLSDILLGVYVVSVFLAERITEQAKTAFFQILTL